VNTDAILHFEIGSFIIYEGRYYAPVSFWTGYKEDYLFLLTNISMEILDSATNVHEQCIHPLKKKLQIHRSNKNSGSK